MTRSDRLTAEGCRPCKLMLWVSAVSALAGIIVGRMLGSARPELERGTRFGQPRAIAAVLLQDLAVRPFADQSLVGIGANPIFFGCNTCPDIYPTKMSIRGRRYQGPMGRKRPVHGFAGHQRPQQLQLFVNPNPYLRRTFFLGFKADF